MASKNIRDITLKVNAKDIKSAASDAAKLNKSLAAMIETVKNSSRSFNSINKSMKDMASSVKTFNRAISAAKSSTKGLENYRARVDDTRKTLMSMRHEAENTLKTMKSLNSAMDRASSATNMREELLDLKDGFQRVVEELQQMNQAMKLNNIYTIDMETSLGKMAARTKEVRAATGRSADSMTSLIDAFRGGKASGDSLNQSLRGLAGQGRTSSRGFSELAFKMNPLTSIYASIAINVYAAAEAFRVLDNAANLERLLSQTASFSAAVSGLNVKGLARDMMELSGGALSLSESLSFATKGTAFNFTAEQLERLTVGARKASIALGRDFNDSMDRVLRGISKQEIELFDELGIVTRLTPAFEAYAGQVGKTVDQLSDYERQLALTEEVQRQMDQRFSGIEVTTTSWERLGKAAQTSLDNMLMALQRTASPLADFTANILEAAGSVTAAEKANQDLTESTDIFNKAIESKNLGSAMVALGQYSKAAKEGADSLDEISESANEAEENVSTLNTALQVLAGILATIAIRRLAVGVSAVSVALGINIKNTSKVIRTYKVLAARAGVAYGAMKAFGTGIEIVSKSLRSLLIASIPFMLVLGAAAGVVYAFREEINELTGGLLELLPGMDSLGEARKAKENIRETEQSLLGMRKALVSAGIAVEYLTDEQIEDMGNALNAFTRDFATARKELQSFATVANKPINPFSDVIDQINSISLTNQTKSIQGIEEVTRKTSEAFREFADSMGVSPSIESAEELAAELTKVGNTLESLSSRIGKMNIEMDLKGAESSIKTLKEVEMTQQAINQLRNVGVNFDRETYKQLLRTLSLLKLRVQLESETEQIQAVRNSEDRKAQMYRARTLGKYQEEATVLEVQLASQKNILAVMKSKSSTGTQELLAQQAVVDALGVQIDRQKEIDGLNKVARTALLQQVELQNSINAANERSTLGGRRLSEITKAQQEVSKLEAAIAVASTELAANFDSMSGEDQAIAQSNIAAMQDSLDIAKWKEQAAAMRDVAVAAGEVANSVPGMTALQSEFMNTFSSISTTLANATELVGGGIELTLKDVADGITSVGTLTANVMSELTKGVVSDIDAQIAAEKRKDGKSQESLAKIRQLEAKKIKEQEKSKIAQTGMATALSIMQAYAELGPIAGSFAAAGLAALGALQLNNIKKASAGQLAALDDGAGSNLSLTVGSRNNAVDVSQRASMGEIAYLRGDQGVGSSANSFTPGRAGGGSIIVGERGPEEISPLQPLSVTPSSSSGEGSSGLKLDIGGLTIQSIDSESFAEAAERNSQAFWDAIEKEAQARGINLEKLK